MKNKLSCFVRHNSEWFYPLLFWTLSLIILIIVMHIFEDKSIFEAFYYGMVTASTTGYGDVLPTSVIGRTCTILYMLTAITTMGMFINALFAKAKNINKRKKVGMYKITKAPKLVIIGYPSENKVVHLVTVIREYWKNCTIVCITDKINEKASWMYEKQVDFIKGRGSQKSVLTLANVQEAENILILAEDPLNVSSDEHTAATIMVCEIFNNSAHTIAEKVGNSRELFEMAKCNKVIDVSRPNELAHEIMNTGSIDFIDSLFSSKTEEHQKNITIADSMSWRVLQTSLITEGEIAIGFSIDKGQSFTFVPKADTIIPKDSIIKILTRQQ